MSRSRVHLVYPHGPGISCPDAIGRKLAEHLRTEFDVILHDWTARGALIPQPGDRIIGHPHPDPRTLFRRSVRQTGWARAIMLCPYAHGDLRQVCGWDTVLPCCDEFLAITGRYWIRTMPSSAYAHWLPRTTHVDLAVDRHDFPVIKKSFGPPGKRRFLYIGNTAWVKNTGYLSEIAAQLPDCDFGWIGDSRAPIKGFRAHGRLNFAEVSSREILADYDFVVTAGFSDANPTVILESMAWGLVPVCTPQSGYEGMDGIASIPLHNATAAANILQALQDAPAEKLLAMQALNWKQLDDHFNWTRFSNQVREALLRKERVPLGTSSAANTLRLRVATAVSPYAPWHPRMLARNLKHRWSQRS